MHDHSIHVTLDYFKEGRLVGWCYSENNLSDTLRIIIEVDGRIVTSSVSDLARNDVFRSGFPKENVGFDITIPESFFDSELHRCRAFCCLETHDRSDDDRAFLDTTFSLPRFKGTGSIDGYHGGAISGWAYVWDRVENQHIDRCDLLIWADGRVIGQIKADHLRPDVANAHNCPLAVGFSFSPPFDKLSSNTVKFNLSFVATGESITADSLTLRVPENAIYDGIRAMREEVDDVFASVWALRKRLSDLLPTVEYHISDYNSWAVQYFRSLTDRFESEGRGPLVSILCPTYKPNVAHFCSAIESVISQTYTDWELIIIDDKSEQEALDQALLALEKRDERISIFKNKSNLNIANSTNVGLKAARGKYVVLFDHDDLLVPQAIQLMVAYAEAHSAKFIYSDEDKIDSEGRFSEPNLKPNWNYRLLLSQNYICHLAMFDRTLVQSIGLFNKQCDGAQDHDYFLRLSEAISERDIVHVPEILYHWRIAEGSTAASSAAKPYAVQAGMQAVANHLQRKGLRARVSSPLSSTFYRIDPIEEYSASVRLIIPFRDQAQMTASCVASILSKTKYDDFKLTILNNLSSTMESIDLIAKVSGEPRVEVVNYPHEFNYSGMNNAVANSCTEQIVVFINNDITVIHDDWLQIMLNEFRIDEKAAAVGCRLLYPNGLVQHGGVIMGVGGVADHAFRGQPIGDPGYLARGICAQNLSSVTAACLAVKRSVFQEVGGFDEKDLRVAFNDVDLCLKIVKAGHRVVWTPFATAIHHESLSRGSDFTPARRAQFFHENETMRARWLSFIQDDPAYNTHFSKSSGIFTQLGKPEPARTTVDLMHRRQNRR